MQSSNLFVAQVISSVPGSYMVHVIRESGFTEHGDGGAMIQGVCLSSSLAAFLGFKEAVQPQAGSRVLCITASESSCYILGVLPQDDKGFKYIPARASSDQGYASGEQVHAMGHTDRSLAIFGNRRPSDVVAGEYVQSNEFGVMLGLFPLLANLKASELAQIQCFVLDDLVRIISHNFQHYTALGEYNVYHDGKALMAEFSGTSIPAESYGQPCPTSDTASPTFVKSGSSTVDDATDHYEFSDDERIRSIERFKLFLGRLGDLVRFVVVRPREDKKRILGEEVSEPDTGMMDFHVSPDGGVYVRSIKEIFLEKTSWIRVPHRAYSPDDPKGDKDIEYKTKEPFEFNNDNKYKDNPFNYAGQIRDYLAYVDEEIGYKNFNEHKKDFYVSKSQGEEKTLDSINQVDEHTKTKFSDYKRRDAGIYMMPNGGIMLKDAWGSAIVMEGGNISLQPAKDLNIEPLRNLIGKVGGFTSIATKHDVDISSTLKGFRLKTEKSQYFYSDKSGIVLECNPEQDTAGTPDPSVEAITDIGGIVLKSSKGIYSYADKTIMQYSKDKILIQAKANCEFIVDKALQIYGKQSVLLLSDNQIFAIADSNIGIFSKGNVELAGTTNTLLGQKDKPFPFSADPTNMFALAAAGGLWGVIDTPVVTKSFETFKTALDSILTQTVFSSEQKFDALKFKYLPSHRYGNLIEKEDALPSTIAQQEDKLSSIYSLIEWTEKEINSTLPYPGKDKYDTFFFNAEKPNNWEAGASGPDFVHKASPDKSPASINLASLQQYKVQPSA